MSIRIIELFGGIGACSKALERIGVDYKIVDYVEIDKYAVRSFNAIHGTNFEPQDVTKWDKDINVDLIMHGSPCQDFSVAGKGAGGDKDSGTRSSLMYETLRIVEKLKPKYVIWENVKNLLSEKHKHNYFAYIDSMAKLGYKSFGRVLNAKDFGVPQNRERVFTVSIRERERRFEWPSPIPLERKLKDILDEQVDEKYYLKKTENLVFSDSRAQWDNSGKGYGSQQDRAYYQDGLSPTLSRCNENGDKAQVILADKAQCIGGVGDKRSNNGRQWALQNRVYQGEVSTAVTGTFRPYYETGEPRKDNLTNTITSVRKDNYVAQCYRIRKLTPKECWRLMGFGDDDFERAEKVCSNTQLYKQAGNSIVVNVLEAILTNLLKGANNEKV